MALLGFLQTTTKLAAADNKDNCIRAFFEVIVPMFPNLSNMALMSK